MYEHKLHLTKDMQERINKYRHCETKRFFANKLVDDLDKLKEENIQKLFAVCVLLNIPKIYIGSQELITSPCKYNSSPAAWELSHRLSGASYIGDANHNGFYSGCGNSNQTQISHSSNWFPDKYINRAWYVETQQHINNRLFKKDAVCTKDM